MDTVIDGMVKVSCTNCKKIFDKDIGHFKENVKLGHNFYCSKRCQYIHHMRGRFLKCENPSCKNEFYRNIADISPSNYCSRSCSAKMNNEKFPRPSRAIWKVCANLACHKSFHGHSQYYCCLKCRTIARYRYTKEQLIIMLQSAAQTLNRIPGKRELKDIANCCVYAFGTWNAAIVAAGLEPNRSHDHRMYKRVKTMAADGHLCDSVSEAIVDNWLTNHGIPHMRNIPYPKTHHKADWAVGPTTFIEYFGLAKDSPRYDRAIVEKRKLCAMHGINLVEIYPDDIYPVVRLETKLPAWLTSSRIVLADRKAVALSQRY